VGDSVEKQAYKPVTPIGGHFTPTRDMMPETGFRVREQVWDEGVKNSNLWPGRLAAESLGNRGPGGLWANL